MRPEVKEILDRLTPEQVKDLTDGLLDRERKDARSRAITMASALEANLKVAGQPYYASLVKQILHNLLNEGGTTRGSI